MMRRIGLMALAAAAAATQGIAAGVPTVLHVSSHLPRAAKASLDGMPAVSAPGEGSTNIPAAAGRHVLKIVTAAGATYQTTLDLKPAQLMTWKGRGLLVRQPAGPLPRGLLDRGLPGRSDGRRLS